LNLVLDSGSLLGSLDRVKLGAEVSSLLAMGRNFPVESRAQGFFSAERLRGLGCPRLTGGKSGVGLGEFGGQGTCFLSDASTVQLNGLEFYEVFSELLHLCQEGYGIVGPFKKSGTGSRIQSAATIAATMVGKPNRVGG
jgi:hypothetical protein